MTEILFAAISVISFMEASFLFIQIACRTFGCTDEQILNGISEALKEVNQKII